METEHLYYGCVFVDRRCLVREELHGGAGIISFLHAHLFDEGEVRIMGPHPQRMIFRAVNGVDLFSELRHHGIDLRKVYNDITRAAVARGIDRDEQREPWEDYYDSVGLSPKEISMRQRVKRIAKSTTTIAGVGALLKGTYFDASFETEDGLRAWSYFDSATSSASPLTKTESGGWRDESRERQTLSPTARIKYTGSGEDVHCFIILDPPE